MLTIYLIIHGLIEKSDSIGGDLAFQYRLFKRCGLPVRVFAEQYSSNLYPDIPIEHIDRLETAIKEKPSMIIYHWVDGWNKIDELLATLTLSIPVIVRWHNNTPPWFFAPYSIDSTMRTTQGFKLISKIAKAKNIKFWVNSEFTRRQLEMLDVLADRIDLVYPASHHIENEYVKNKQISKEPIKKSNIRLLFVGRITPHKGYNHMVIAAYVLQKWLGRKVEIHFPGRQDMNMSDYTKNVKKIASDLKISVYFHGEVDLIELNRLYKTSDVYLSLSEHEGFGLPIIEAMQMGIPVVGYKTAAIAELLENHPLACDNLDYFDIAKKIAAVLLKDDIRTAVINWQYRAILPHFSRQTIENQIINALNKKNIIIKNAGNNDVKPFVDMNGFLKIKAMADKSISELEKYNPIPMIPLPLVCKDYRNHYMTNYDISAYDSLLLRQKTNLEEINLSDEAMEINFSSHRRLLGPLIIKIKKLILLLQDGIVRVIAKLDVRLEKRISQLDEKISYLGKKIDNSIKIESVKKTDNALSDFYDEEYFEGKKIKSVYDSYSRDAKMPNKKLAETLWQLFKPKSFLDAGCALGFVVKELRKYGVNAYGIDISKWAVKKANVSYISLLDISKQTIFGEYEIITAYDVLEHIPESMLPFVINNLWQATRKHLIVIPSYYEEGIKCDPGEPGHIVFHSKIWWENLFEACNIPLDRNLAEELGNTDHSKIYNYSGKFIVCTRQ
ncbi:MAG: glycosyltransferase [Patescibacteria group bacterium]